MEGGCARGAVRYRIERWLVAIGSTVVVTALITAGAVIHVLDRSVPEDAVLNGTIRSARLQETREFLVHLPDSYDREPARRYPVLYVLDGTSQDGHTAASAGFMARIGVIPEVVLVGIPNVSNGRQRDYTPPGMRQDAEVADSPPGAGDAFLAFLRDELIPRIEADYRTTRPRMLAGNSRGGLFVVYSLIADPSLFDGRFAHSPALWRDDDALVRRLDEFLASPPVLDGFLFLSLGEQENPKMTAAFDAATDVLRSRAPETLRWCAAFSRGGTHADNAHLSTPVGLLSMLGQGQPPCPPPMP